MSLLAAAPCEEERPPVARTDSLAQSVVILLALTVVQRLIGFVRGVLFCRWLDDDQLGQWDLCFGFLMLAAPVAVLGLPGSFGRYVEYYRQRGQLRAFIARVGKCCVVLTLIAMTLVVLARSWFSRLIFGSEGHEDMVLLLAACLGALGTHSVLGSLYNALRWIRLASRLQLLNTLAFALAGVALLLGWQRSTQSAVAAFTIACTVSAIVGLACLRQSWRDLPNNAGTMRHSAFWAKLAPFAVWIWLTNWLANLFELADRYMIVHYSGLAELEAFGQIGQYHSSRVVPLLFVGFAELLAAMITPHLSHDWEAGRRESVSVRLNLGLKLLAFGLTAASVLVLLFSDVLFGVVLGGRYSGGLVVLPWALAYCAWRSLALIAMNYLWCVERASLPCAALLVGLILNIALNSWLLPRYGLIGAAWATSAANLTTLFVVYATARLNGMRLERGTWLMALVPLLVCLDIRLASIALLALAVIAAVGNRLLSAEEKRRLSDAWLEYSHRLQAYRHHGQPDQA